jgi:phage repressor protein C with HTH and peptisase S24 domain
MVKTKQIEFTSQLETKCRLKTKLLQLESLKMTQELEGQSANVLKRLMQAYEARNTDELALKLEIPAATVRTWQKRGGVPAKYCEKAALDRGVLLDWLMLGRLADGSERAIHFDLISSLVNHSRHYEVPQGTTALLLNEPSAAHSELVELSKYDCSGSCGPGNLIDSARVIDHIPVSRQWLRREGLQAESTIIIGSKGDSMAPKIPPGAMLLVNLAKRDPSFGGVFAFTYANELFIKYIQQTEDGLYVSSEQSDHHPPRFFKWDEADQLRIEGRIHMVLSRV